MNWRNNILPITFVAAFITETFNNAFSSQWYQLLALVIIVLGFVGYDNHKGRLDVKNRIDEINIKMSKAKTDKELDLLIKEKEELLTQ